MLSVLLSIFNDFAITLKSFFSGYTTEILFVIGVIFALKAASEYCKNKVDTDWFALKSCEKAAALSAIMLLEWEHYAFLMKYLLSKQDYKIIGSSINSLSGMDVLAEKSKKRFIVRFGRSTAESIYDRDLRELSIKARQFHCSSCIVVTAGHLSSSAREFKNDLEITLLDQKAFIEWLNKYAGANLQAPADEYSPGLGMDPYQSSDNDLLAA